ncbi:MAG: polysaccharide deacetylase family protein [Chloroflexales bacterium]|nr:polysaccharide deacetylase family protein [Chloroflexales bacterium]
MPQTNSIIVARLPTLTETAATLSATLPPASPSIESLQPAATSTHDPTTPTPQAPEVIGYTAYRVQAGDTLASISKQGGSLPELLMSYNRLSGEPQAGRELIIPRVRGKGSLLPKTALMVVKGNTAKPWVALTLDCGGDNPRTIEILDTLKAANVPITFFILGGSIINDPDLLHRMVADGHELANHSFTHADFTTLTDEEIVAELHDTEKAIHGIVGTDVSIRPYFRFPYGAYDRRVLGTVVANGYLPIHWTLDSLDAVGKPKSPEFLVERMTQKLPPEELPGAIMLAHCTGKVADALPEILERFAAAGFEVRTLSDVLGA